MGKLLPYLFFFVGILLAILALPSVWDTYQVALDADDFEEIEAVVISQQKRKHKQGPATHEVEFEFEIDGREYRSDNRYTRLSDDADTLDRQIRREGGIKRITVYYDPNDPERAVISRDVDLFWPTVLLFVTLFAFFGGGHAAWIDRKRTRMLRED